MQLGRCTLNSGRRVSDPLPVEQQMRSKFAQYVTSYLRYSFKKQIRRPHEARTLISASHTSHDLSLHDQAHYAPNHLHNSHDLHHYISSACARVTTSYRLEICVPSLQGLRKGAM